jgi:hypothetical protein
MKPADADDAKVDAEWRRIEEERIAQERAEAVEDVEPGRAETQPGPGLPRWQMIAMALALIGGLAMALFFNRSQPSPEQPPPSQDRSPR